MPVKSKRTAEQRAAATKKQEYTYEGPMDTFYESAAKEAAGEGVPRGGKVMLSADQVEQLRAYGSRFTGHGVTPSDTVPQSVFPAREANV